MRSWTTDDGLSEEGRCWVTAAEGEKKASRGGVRRLCGVYWSSHGVMFIQKLQLERRGGCWTVIGEPLGKKRQWPRVAAACWSREQKNFFSTKTEPVGYINIGDCLLACCEHVDRITAPEVVEALVLRVVALTREDVFKGCFPVSLFVRYPEKQCFYS